MRNVSFHLFSYLQSVKKRTARLRLHTVTLCVAIYIIVPSILFVACDDDSFSKEYYVTINFEIPEVYRSVQTWRILYVDDTNAVQELMMDNSTKQTSLSFEIAVMRNCALPVLAYPADETDCTSFVKQQFTTTVSYVPEQKPLGAIYPYGTSLTLGNGFAADILKTLYGGASEGSGTAAQVREYLSRFNWTRLMEACDSYEDAWLLDRGRILEGIANGTFKASSLVLCGG